MAVTPLSACEAAERQAAAQQGGDGIRHRHLHGATICKAIGAATSQAPGKVMGILQLKTHHSLGCLDEASQI